MSMMNCIECKSSIEYCFCSCPYCGNTVEQCLCNFKYSNKRKKLSSNTQYSKLRLLKQSNKTTFVNTTDDDNERCLEKWQIGRSKFC